MEYNEEHVDGDTILLNGGGEYIQYGDAKFGPFIVKFQRAEVNTVVDHKRNAEWIIEGPMIDQVVEMACHVLNMEMMDVIGTWDTVKRCDEEVKYLD